MKSTNEVVMSTPAIEFRNVSLAFDDLQALSDVNFALRPNEMLFITGASGSGKSVLLRLAIGLLRPDAGQIYILGREITGLGEDEILRIRSERLGMVFQDEALFTGMDVYDNAAYRLVEHHVPAEEINSAVNEILGFVGLDKDTDKAISELSGGMKRRLELARAIIGWPPIMLLDEATTGLDPINARQVRDIIIRARDFHQMSSLYVTKAMHEIKYLATHYAERDEMGSVMVLEADAAHRPLTRVLVLDDGKVIFLGSYDEFCESAHPAILQLMHPRPSATNPDFRTSDPWNRKSRLTDEF